MMGVWCGRRAHGLAGAATTRPAAARWREGEIERESVAERVDVAAVAGTSHARTRKAGG
jgi:hypothetical protein